MLMRIRRKDSIPTTEIRPEQGRVVLAHGEVTGHSHSISPQEATLYSDGAVTELEVKAAMAMLEHQEHGTIALPKGRYRVIRQREYSPEAIRNVAD